MEEQLQFSAPVTYLANYDALGNNNPAVYNSLNVQGGPQGSGLLSPVYAVGAGLTHAAVSFYNSGKAIYNLVVSEENEAEMTDVGEVLTSFSQDWGSFYERNENAITITSDIASLLIPGTLAVKGLGLAQKANSAIATAKAAGMAPKYSDRALTALDVFNTQNRRRAFIQKAETADAQAPLFANYNILRGANATAESLNESVVLSAVSFTMMNQSSLFEDYSAGDFVRDVAFGTSLGAPIRYILDGAQVGKVRTAKEISENMKNQVSGSFVSSPADERVSRLLQDIDGVQNPEVRQRGMTKVKEEFAKMLAGSKEEKAQIYGALSYHVDSLNYQTFNEMWLGTDEVTYFSRAALTPEKNQVVVNSRSGNVLLPDEVVPTAGDLRIKPFKTGGGFTLTSIDGKERKVLNSKFKNQQSFFSLPAEEVDGYAVSMMHAMKHNPRSIAQNPLLLGPDVKWAVKSNDWAQIQAASAFAKENGRSVGVIVGKNLEMWDAQKLAEHTRNLKTALVKTAFDLDMPFDDINVRFGVNAEKMLKSGFTEGHTLYDSVAKAERYMQPSNLLVTRKKLTSEFPDRDTFLGQWDARAAQVARKEAYHQHMGPIFRDVMDIEQLPKMDARSATMQSDTSRVILPGAQGAYGSITEAAETMGTIVATAQDKIARKLLDPFVSVGQALVDTPLARVEVSAAMAYMRTQPGKVILSRQQDGRMVLLDKATQNPLLDRANGGAFSVSKEAGDFLEKFREANDTLIRYNNANVAASGVGKELELGVFYAPPPNLDRYPHAAFVKSASGQVRAVTANSPEDLQDMMRIIRAENPSFEVMTVAEAKKNQQLYKEYKDSSMFDDPEFDFALNRKGSFAPAVPKVDESVVEDALEWLAQQGRNTVRRIAKNAMSDDLDELNFMGQRIANTQATMGSREADVLRKGNVYHDLVKTALNLSKYEEYTAIQKVNQTAEQVYSGSMGKFRAAWRQRQEAGDYEAMATDINDIMKKTGVNFDYSNLANLAAVNRKATPAQLADDVRTANGALATLSLGLDFLYPIVNAIGFGVVGWPELRSMANSLGKTAALESSLAVKSVDGTSVPAPSKVMASVVRDMWDSKKRDALKAKYANVGTIDSTIFEAQDTISGVIDRIAAGKPGAVKQFVKDRVDSITKYTIQGSNGWLQIMAHETADRLLRAAGMTDESAITAMRSQFSKRVNGNYTASQRGALLQGPLGHALGLFQTWTLGVVSNFMRYVGNKETTNIAALLGAQSAAFGVQSNPAFQYLNQHLVARSQENEGLYQKYADLGDIGDWALYGVPSSIFKMSLYTRGDITPHNPTILPTNFAQVPAVNATIRAYGAVRGLLGKTAADFEAQGLSAFGGVDNNIASAIALSGLNRPLAGVATLYNGYSQVSAGGIGGQVIDPDVVNIGAWTRVVGSRPLNEQKMLDSYYRYLDAEAGDRKKTLVIGAAIRAKVASGQELSSEDLKGYASQYIQAGGNPRGVAQFVQQQMVMSNTTMAERVYKKLHNDGDFAEWRALIGAAEDPSE